jgi:hypothetical protein
MKWRPRLRLELPWALMLALAPAGCGEPQPTPGPGLAPGARPDIVATLRDDLKAVRHAADGGGRAWLEPDPEGRDRVAAGEAGRWTIVYEAGELGIAEGGWLFFQVPPHWGWSDPQPLAVDVPGYTEVTSAAAGVELSPAILGTGLLGIRIDGRALATGERVRIVYGADPLGARADRFAERGSRFWISVDGDGDGIRGLIADQPEVTIASGPPARLVVHLPAIARPGETVQLTVAMVDGLGNAAAGPSGAIELSGPGDALEHTERLRLDGGRGRVEVTARETGVWRIEAETSDGLEGRSNPMIVSPGAARVLWADLHGHSNFSDGTGTPEDYFAYARDVGGLDVAALTDHDHWGLRPLAQHPAMWAEIRRQAKRFHEPGRFVTLLGYEWTNWLHGHRHVLYFEDRGELLSSIDPAYETPPQLWRALRGKPALTFAHHSAGGPIATNWHYPPDPELEPVTEVVSVHGSSEATDSPGPIYNPVSGNFVRDVLERGYRLGLIGSGDGHDGHPGLAHLASPSGGLAAILAEELTREAVLEALKARRVYATNGPRIYLAAELEGHPMGSTLLADELGDEVVLTVRAAAPGPLEAIDLVRSGGGMETASCDGRFDCTLSRTISGLERGGYLYLRARQIGGGTAWSSPFFFD